MKKTPWFGPDIEPVRNGFYEREWDPKIVDRDNRLDYWDGINWSYGARNDDGNLVVVRVFDPIRLRWRGLQGDEHSLEIGASTYLVEFGDEGRDRPRDDE